MIKFLRFCIINIKMYPRLLQWEKPTPEKRFIENKGKWTFLCPPVPQNLQYPLGISIFINITFMALKNNHLFKIWRPPTCSLFSSWQKEVKNVLIAWFIYILQNSCYSYEPGWTNRCDKQCKISATECSRCSFLVYGSPCDRPGWAVPWAAVLRTSSLYPVVPLPSWTAEHTTGLSTSGRQQGNDQSEDLLGLPGPEAMVVPSIPSIGQKGESRSHADTKGPRKTVNWLGEKA